LKIESLNWDKMNGLLPAIVQHAHTGKVLMLGYMSPESLQESLVQNTVIFFSRSKNRQWMKGETSGNFLTIKQITPDCDKDALLICVEPAGNTCHQGVESCFVDAFFTMEFMSYIEHIIEQRKNQPSEGSYICQLLKSGLHRIAQKVGEEAVETVIAAIAQSDDVFLDEMADLFFHMQLLLSVKGFAFKDVMTVMRTRHLSR
jgi:phosphoribosyl-AMP cyclohydrolase / phosphoribosyl-ATP pyrophosphohydrolase